MQKVAKEKPSRLSNEDKYLIGEYIIEYNGVTQLKDGGYEFRVKQNILAKEITEDLCPVNPWHLRDCVDFYILVNKLAKRPVIVPPKIEADPKEIEVLKGKIAELNKNIEGANRKIKHGLEALGAKN
jgi:hypothetical protein